MAGLDLDHKNLPQLNRRTFLVGTLLAVGCGGAALEAGTEEDALFSEESVTDGDEESLVWELVDAVNGVEPRSAAWKTGDGMHNAMTGLGSVNIPMLRWAVRLWRDPVGFKAEDVWISFFNFSRGKWMSSEVGSRIYGNWHMLAALAVYSYAKQKRRTTLAAAAKEWLTHWWAFCKLAEAPTGRILMLGMRSAGHAPNPGKFEWLYALAMGGDIAYWESQCRMYGVGLRLSWEYAVATRLKVDLMDSAAVVRAASRPETVIPRFGLRTGFHFLRTASGLAVWCDHNVNGNTAPIMGAVYKDGALNWLPANGGLRIRQKFETATCARVGNTLDYRAEYHGNHTLALPTDSVISDVTLPL